ncbi:hypothetical protein P154DRAFT_617784 [Amniculicola lignicola CBS 123094]|uniref:Uncharacterized protein n=1 Tax=Amniculicola lignicola CBS 123094 TaxID=1392246 RepID=A0A6A5WPR2_9PLEO|nr:hypothetical protein P154DRAFT_617784 [Amniculicola lignicola CBS 123094]
MALTRLIAPPKASRESNLHYTQTPPYYINSALVFILIVLSAFRTTTPAEPPANASTLNPDPAAWKKVAKSARREGQCEAHRLVALLQPPTHLSSPLRWYVFQVDSGSRIPNSGVLPTSSGSDTRITPKRLPSVPLYHFIILSCPGGRHFTLGFPCRPFGFDQFAFTSDDHEHQRQVSTYPFSLHPFHYLPAALDPRVQISHAAPAIHLYWECSCISVQAIKARYQNSHRFVGLGKKGSRPVPTDLATIPPHRFTTPVCSLLVHNLPPWPFRKKHHFFYSPPHSSKRKSTHDNKTATTGMTIPLLAIANLIHPIAIYELWPETHGQEACA